MARDFMYCVDPDLSGATKLVGDVLSAQNAKMAAGPISKTDLWKSDAADWRVTEFDDTYFVFLRSSGETHFLNFLSFGILTCAANAPVSSQEVSTKLRKQFQLDVVELPESLVKATIEQLDEVGLLYPVAQS